MNKITIAAGQTLYDVCMQYYGCAEAIVMLCNDNGLSAYDVQPKPGTLLKIRSPVPAINTSNLNVLSYYLQRNIQVATSLPPYAGPYLSTSTGLPIITNTGLNIVPVNPKVILTHNGLVLLTNTALSILAH